MKIIRGIKNLKIKQPTVATIGIFDGIHRGHKRILELLKKRAKDIKAKSCVLTFDPHPSRILHPYRTPPMLISTRHKLHLLAAEGVDITVLINFTKNFASIGPRRFVTDVLVERMNIKELLVGKNFLFGKKRRGTVKILERLGENFDFRVRAIPSLKMNGRIISSTLIRSLIMSGRLNEAERLIGREVSILGTVTKGTKRGRILGFPTANLDLHHEAIPPNGVYIVKVRLENREYRGILNIGFRPTFAPLDNKSSRINKIQQGEYLTDFKGTIGKRESTVEVYIFNFNKSIYGKDIEVIFLKRIRSERRFRNREGLLSRIQKDIDIARKYFKKRK